MFRGDAYAPFREPNYVRFVAGGALANLGQTMLGTAVGWELYERTHSALMLGWVGFVQIIPVFLFALPAGQLADRLDRRKLAMAGMALMAASSLGLAGLSATQGPLLLFYACIFLAAVGQSFAWAARSSLLPGIVSAEQLEKAITWNSSAGQLAYLIGPALAGLAIGSLGAAAPIYALDAATMTAFVLALAGMTYVKPMSKTAPPGWKDVLVGLSFVFGTPLMLAAITLDMFAVLLGGATTLLPVFAKDVLHVGPQGLGWLLAAPSLGAFLTGLVMATRPGIRRNGPVLLVSVAAFGLATLGFAWSQTFWLSWVMLCLVGATDMVSMVIRLNMMQRLTPDAMRGRVSAVHSVFIGTSNELGGFESGLTAHWWGPVRSVMVGGFGTLAVVGLVAARWPLLRRMREIPMAPMEDALATVPTPSGEAALGVRSDG